jgi:hypothetical protein
VWRSPSKSSFATDGLRTTETASSRVPRNEAAPPCSGPEEECGVSRTPISPRTGRPAGSCFVSTVTVRIMPDKLDHAYARSRFASL